MNKCLFFIEFMCFDNYRVLNVIIAFNNMNRLKSSGSELIHKTVQNENVIVVFFSVRNDVLQDGSTESCTCRRVLGFESDWATSTFYCRKGGYVTRRIKQ